MIKKTKNSIIIDVKYCLRSKKETAEFAKKLGESLEGGEIIALEGQMGSGKTTFTKGIAAGLGILESVTSPTFGILKIYDGGRLRLCHFDAYRLSGAGEALEIGLDEYLGDKKSVCVIEWPSKIHSLLKEYKHTKIDFQTVDENTRKIEIQEENTP